MSWDEILMDRDFDRDIVRDTVNYLEGDRDYWRRRVKRERRLSDILDEEAAEMRAVIETQRREIAELMSKIKAVGIEIPY